MGSASAKMPGVQLLEAVRQGPSFTGHYGALLTQ